MLDYLERGIDYLGSRDGDRVGNLVTAPSANTCRHCSSASIIAHVSSLAEHEYGQMHFHISDLLHSDRQCFFKAAEKINVPVLLANGEWDEYTAADGVRLFAAHVQHATFTHPAGHRPLSDIKHKAACREASRNALLGFLKPSQHENRPRLSLDVQDQHGLAI